MEKERHYHLDALKIIATTIIIFHHYQQVTSGFFKNLINFWGGKFFWGYIVELFFIISGFFMYRYIDIIKSGACTFKDFFVKRYTRIVPMLIFGAIIYDVAITIYTKFLHCDWFGLAPSLWGTVIACLGIQHGWGFSDLCINYPTWYCSVLLIMYILFYFSVKISQKYGFHENVAFVVIILSGCAIRTCNANLPFINDRVTRGMYSFFAGIILAGFIKNKNSSLKTVALCTAIVTSFVVLFLKFSSFVSDGLIYTLTFIVYPSVIIIFNNKIFKRAFTNRFVKALSDSSFCVFIIHNPFLLLLFIALKIFKVSYDFNNVWYMMLFSLVCWIAGILVHYTYEKGLNKHIGKILAKPKIDQTA